MVRFDQVSKRYPGGKEALTSVNLELAKGEFAFLTGHSGAGKSTLMKLMLLMERPTRGQVFVDEQNLARLPNFMVPYHRRKIGVVFQNHQLLFDRTVFDNVALPLLVAGYSLTDAARRVRAALDSVGLTGLERRNPIELSGGEQQRVGIARAVVHKPALLLADEPTGNLDPELSAEIMNLFSRFQQVGVTVLVATHDIDLVERMGHRRIILEQGQIHGGPHG
ncbi:MAG: cell division ATP-binding protein FtsE [Venatoribacter sp.]